MEAYNGLTIVSTLLAGFAISILVTDDSPFVDGKDSWSNHATTMSAVTVVCLNLLSTVTLGYILFMVRYIAPESDDPEVPADQVVLHSPADEHPGAADHDSQQGPKQAAQQPASRDVQLTKVDAFWALTDWYRQIAVYSTLFSVPLFLFCILAFVWGKFGVVTTDKSSFNGPALVSVIICVFGILATLVFFVSIYAIAGYSARLEEDPHAPSLRFLNQLLQDDSDITPSSK